MGLVQGLTLTDAGFKKERFVGLELLEHPIIADRFAGIEFAQQDVQEELFAFILSPRALSADTFPWALGARLTSGRNRVRLLCGE